MNLEFLGLNKYEAAALESVARMGKASAFQISQDSEVPYGRIYDTLYSLASKGLVVVVPEESKKFALGNPEVMNEMLNQREKELGRAREEIKELKQVYKELGEEPIEIVKGKRNFFRLIKKLPKANKYAYSFKFALDTSPELIRHDKERIAKGVDGRALASSNQAINDNIREWISKSPKASIKRFDFDKVACEIVDDKITWFALVESNITFIVRDENFVKLMRELFKTAWKQSK